MKTARRKTRRQVIAAGRHQLKLVGPKGILRILNREASKARHCGLEDIDHFNDFDPWIALGTQAFWDEPQLYFSVNSSVAFRILGLPTVRICAALGQDALAGYLNLLASVMFGPTLCSSIRSEIANTLVGIYLDVSPKPLPPLDEQGWQHILGDSLR